MISILIVEDHEKVAGLIARFVKKETGVLHTEIVNSAETALSTLAESNGKKGDHHPDLILVDVSLPGMSGIDLVEKIRQEYPNLRCVMLSGHDDPSYVQRSMEAGAFGYVIKGNPAEIVEAVCAVLDGGTFISGEIDLT